MKYCIILMITLMAVGLSAQEADTLFSLNLPQFANPFYETFSRNFLSTEAAGRGHTGISILGGGPGALQNPATLRADSIRAFVELNIKPPEDADGFIYNSRYSSPIPFSILGTSFAVNRKMNMALMYNMPKSIILDDFTVEINQGGDLVTRYPKYYLHQATAGMNFQATEKLRIGMNLHAQLHYLDDVVFLRTYDRIREYFYDVRFQPGLLYGDERFAIGLTATPATKIDWDLKYARYESELPLEIAAGTSFASQNYRLAADFRYRQDSAIHDDFADKYDFHFGAERRRGNQTLRVGYMYSSNVYNGTLMLPVNTSATADTSMFWDDVFTSVEIPDNQQHFLTLGMGIQFRDGSLNLAALQTIVGDSKQTQVNLSLSLYLSSFKRKDFLYYE